MKLRTIITIAMAIMQLLSCSHPANVGGGGSEVEVVGKVYLPGNEPAPATQVKLIPWDYDPSVMVAINDSLIDTSDLQGQFSFKNVAPGKYNILAVHLKQRTRMLITGVEVDSGITTVSTETLREPGSIRVLFIDDADRNGYAALPGTDIAAFFTAGSREILIDSVPSGKIPEVRYHYLGDTVTTSEKDVVVGAAATTTIENPSWRYMLQIRLNTSTSGAGVNGDVIEFPVLIRLNGNNFYFTQTQDAGADLRFTSSIGKTLPYEIEQWNTAAQKALIWVNVDTIHGNDSMQSITMHWGNPAATALSNSSMVFDTTAGFQGVWHMDNSICDATANGFDGAPYHTSPVSGAIGNAHVFDGDSSYITMPNTASGKLNFPYDDNFSISAWVYSDLFDNKYRTIASKGFQQYFLQLSSIPVAEKPWWQFSVFGDTATWEMSHTPAVEQQWVLLTGVRQGTTQSLYCNGMHVATISQVFKQDTTMLRNTSDDFSIGRFFTEATFPIRGYCYFKGKIDEVRICNTARSADWIRLCYMNQRGDDALVKFDK